MLPVADYNTIVAVTARFLVEKYYKRHLIFNSLLHCSSVWYLCFAELALELQTASGPLYGRLCWCIWLEAWIIAMEPVINAT